MIEYCQETFLTVISFSGPFILECEGKLFLGNQTEVSIFSAASDIVGKESYMTDESTGKVTLTKEIFSPKKFLKKPKHNNRGSSPRKRCSSPKGHIEGLTKKGSSPKGRIGGSRLTRSLPGLCSGRTSVEACRESVVAFSQRQMQDIESIAVNLMSELKSMKDFIEQKVFDEAFRCTSRKKDADEVWPARNILASHLAIFSSFMYINSARWMLSLDYYKPVKGEV